MLRVLLLSELANFGALHHFLDWNEYPRDHSLPLDNFCNQTAILLPIFAILSMTFMHSLNVRILPCSCYEEKIYPCFCYWEKTLNLGSYCSYSYWNQSLSWMKHPSMPVDSRIETLSFVLIDWSTSMLLCFQVIYSRFVSRAAFG